MLMLLAGTAWLSHYVNIVQERAAKFADKVGAHGGPSQSAHHARRPAQRIALVSESLTAMKLIKLSAWSEAFLARVQEVRANEVIQLMMLNLFRWAATTGSSPQKWTLLNARVHTHSAVNRMASFVVPAVVSLVTFATFALTSSEPLTASRTFTALLLFNTLREVQSGLPGCLAARARAPAKR